MWLRPMTSPVPADWLAGHLGRRPGAGWRRCVTGIGLCFQAAPQIAWKRSNIAGSSYAVEYRSTGRKSRSDRQSSGGVHWVKTFRQVSPMAVSNGCTSSIQAEGFVAPERNLRARPQGETRRVRETVYPVLHPLIPINATKMLHVPRPRRTHPQNRNQ